MMNIEVLCNFDVKQITKGEIELLSFKIDKTHGTLSRKLIAVFLQITHIENSS